MLRSGGQGGYEKEGRMRKGLPFEVGDKRGNNCQTMVKGHRWLQIISTYLGAINGMFRYHSGSERSQLCIAASCC